ncbi:MAG: hypothetical protein ACREJO_04295 [Phycisphaerales bacterium]
MKLWRWIILLLVAAAMNYLVAWYFVWKRERLYGDAWRNGGPARHTPPGGRI